MIGAGEVLLEDEARSGCGHLIVMLAPRLTVAQESEAASGRSARAAGNLSVSFGISGDGIGFTRC
jgi:hypothetical protein